MRRKKDARGTWVAAIAVSLVVVLLIGGLAVVDWRKQERDGITLPPTQQTSDTTETSPEPEDGFLEITAENAPQVVASLQRPPRYHQTLRVEYFAADTAGSPVTVEQWVSGEIRRIVRKTPTETKNLLSDGKTVYLWYQDENWSVKSTELSPDVTLDELAGVPTYESICTLPKDAVEQAAYTVSAEPENAPCIAVTAKIAEDVTADYQVDLSTGLLIWAENRRGSELTYRQEQTALEMPELQDGDFIARFQLPNGKTPFPIAEE